MQLENKSNIGYITDMTIELAKMAKHENRFLALLLEMAVKEGKEILKKQSEFCFIEEKETPNHQHV